MEREKRIILIGRTGCGKTTLMQAVEQTDIVYRKTQTVCHHLHFIDTPGEYLENRGFYKIRRAEALLRRAGVGRIFRVSSVQRQGTGELAQFLRQPSGGGQKTHIIR